MCCFPEPLQSSLRVVGCCCNGSRFSRSERQNGANLAVNCSAFFSQSRARPEPHRSGEQPGSAAGSGEEGHAISVTESAAGG
jgi:hypothetical protein